MITPKEILDQEEGPPISEFAVMMKIEEAIDNELKTGFGLNKQRCVAISRYTILCSLFEDYEKYIGYYHKIYYKVIGKYEKDWQIVEYLEASYGHLFKEKEVEDLPSIEPPEAPKKSWFKRYLEGWKPCK